MFLASVKKIYLSLFLVSVCFLVSTQVALAKTPTKPPQNPGLRSDEALYVGTVNTQGGFAANFGSIISTLLSAVIAIGVLAAFLFLIWGSIEWIISGGEKGKIEEGRNKIISAVIGLLVLACCYGIFKLVINVLGFDNLTDALGKMKQLRVE